MAIGFFILTLFSNNTTTNSILGIGCIFNNCQKINAGIMSLVVIFLIVFQAFFYHRYRKHKHEHLN
jgi:Na+-transporting NADH:ubiquinone oxidoreductase subunit NqrD